MSLKPDAGMDFASILNAASQPPEPGQGLGRDLPDGFPLPSMDGHRVVDTSEDGIPGVVAYDFKIHRQVFTIFRPWDGCARCGASIASGEERLPDEGDYECPHVTKDTYESIVNEILAGKLIFGSEQEIPQKDGSIVVSLRWYERIPRKKKKLQPDSGGGVPESPL